MPTRLKALACCLALASAGTAAAQSPPPGPQRHLVMTCMVAGQPHRLEAVIEAVQRVDVWAPPVGRGGRVSPTGTYTYYYSGRVTGPRGQFLFTGENHYGQFFSPNAGGETRARFDLHGNRLTITLEPHGAARRIDCRG